jgi:hypothetical protein
MAIFLPLLFLKALLVGSISHNVTIEMANALFARVAALGAFDPLASVPAKANLMN